MCVGATGVAGPSGPSGKENLPRQIHSHHPPAALRVLDDDLVLISNTSCLGPSGPQGAASIQFAFLGCYTQGCDPSNSCSVTALSLYGFDSQANRGGYQNTFVGNATQNIDAQCAKLCIQQNTANFFGTVLTGTSSGDCYCGAAITGIESTITNCVTCYGQNIGLCGKSKATIAVYARAF